MFEDEDESMSSSFSSLPTASTSQLPSNHFLAQRPVTPPPRVVAQQNTVLQEPPHPPTPAVTPIPISPPRDAAEVVAQQDDSGQEVVHLITISREQKTSTESHRAKSV